MTTAPQRVDDWYTSRQAEEAAKEAARLQTRMDKAVREALGPWRYLTLAQTRDRLNREFRKAGHRPTLVFDARDTLRGRPDLVRPHVKVVAASIRRVSEGWWDEGQRWGREGLDLPGAERLGLWLRVLGHRHRAAFVRQLHSDVF